jgi:hypothetical protein
MQSLSSRLVTFYKTSVYAGTEKGTNSYEKHKSYPDERKIIHRVVPPFASSFY